MPFLRKSLGIILLLTFSAGLHAQNGYSFSIDQERPTGELGFVYKPALGFSFGYYEDINSPLIYDIQIGFHLFKPKQDTFYFLLSDTEYGTSEFGNFFILPITAGASYEFMLLEDKMQLLFGMNMGLCLVTYSENIQGSTYSDNSYVNKWGVFSPKAGLYYSVNKSLGLQIESKYNYIIPFGDDGATIGTTWTNGLSLIYLF